MGDKMSNPDGKEDLSNNELQFMWKLTWEEIISHHPNWRGLGIYEGSEFANIAFVFIHNHNDNSISVYRRKNSAYLMSDYLEYVKKKKDEEAILDQMVIENQEMGLYDEEKK